MATSTWIWAGFLALVAVILVVDLGVMNRRAKVVSPKKALVTTAVFVLLALGFTGVIYWAFEGGHFGASAVTFDGKPMTGGAAAAEYLQGWMLEYSLSVDNLFVFALLFSHFRVPREHQHRVLFWGIMGALVLRGVMIGLGAALIHSFSWVMYVFGGFLLLTAVKMLFMGSGEEDPEKGLVTRVARRVLPLTGRYDGAKFFTIENGRRVGTPLLLVLIIVECTDVVFAVDSIPAIFGVTREPFIVFTSNVFAILGLRSLFFALAGLMDKFHYLKVALCGVLAFIGVKMLLHGVVHISGVVSLAVIAGALGAGVVASLLVPAKAEAPTEPVAGG